MVVRAHQTLQYLFLLDRYHRQSSICKKALVFFRPPVGSPGWQISYIPPLKIRNPRSAIRSDQTVHLLPRLHSTRGFLVAILRASRSGHVGLRFDCLNGRGITRQVRWRLQPGFPSLFGSLHSILRVSATPPRLTHSFQAL